MNSKKNFKQKKESLILGKLLVKIAPRIGARVILEPDWNIAGQITFKSGRHSYFRYNTLDLNPVGASDIAKDKDYANFFMQRMGYPTVPGSRTFFSKEWSSVLGVEDRGIDDAYTYACTLGLPVIVKPNSGSQGTNVALTHTKLDFYRAMRRIFKKDNIALVQKLITGKDYRIVVLDEEVISAYERIPLSVIGDGRSSLIELLQEKQKYFLSKKRDTTIHLDDVRMHQKLERQGLSFDTVPVKDSQIFLLDNANLSTGGGSVDVTDTMHDRFKKLAISLTRDMGLRFCGVDLMIEGNSSDESSHYYVIEINAAPGLDHYVRSGAKQKAIVEALYTKVLQALDR